MLTCNEKLEGGRRGSRMPLLNKKVLSMLRGGKTRSEYNQKPYLPATLPVSLLNCAMHTG
jgi:hypothetical protein